MTPLPNACARLLRAAAAATALLGAAAPALAQIEALTGDGRRVLLHDDGTWEYAPEPEGEAAAPLRLEVLSMADVRGRCVIGLRLHNDAGYLVTSLVLQFEAQVGDGVAFDNEFVGFASIKPTLDQYRSLAFERLACKDIAAIRVHGGDRCTMDDLTKFSPATGECLRRVRILDTPLVRIFK